MKRFRLSRLDTTVVAAVSLACIIAVIFVVRIMRGEHFSVVNNPSPSSNLPIGALSGRPCADGARRPMAVMLAADPEARPLAGIGKADMVFELPVTPNGITRMMAVYQCGTPEEIGSIRSARGDFIGLAQSVDAILAHWGGERDTLERLNRGVIDNIDALTYEGSTFYRKSGVSRPHNGFTTPELLWSRAQGLGYRASTSFPGFVRRTPVPAEPDEEGRSVTLPWPQDMDVTFVYDDASGTYKRSRGGTPEEDALTGEQASAAVIIVATTDATFLRDQYISVRTTGSGAAAVYQSGHRTSAVWKRSSDSSPLHLTTDSGAPLPLEPGTVWVLFNAPLPAVR
jgi:hypothetical protein